VGDVDLTHLSTLSLPDRALRTLALDQNAIAVGEVHVTTFDVTVATNPFVRSTVTVGDPDAPIECIDFSEVLGNSSDAIFDDWENDWEGDDWEEGDWDDDDGCN
jgi:hypothetical protein